MVLRGTSGKNLVELTAERAALCGLEAFRVALPSIVVPRGDGLQQGNKGLRALETELEAKGLRRSYGHGWR
jgi:hypothetical protein